MDLGELASDGAAMEFINGFLGKILPAGDVDGFEPSFLAPASRSDWSNSNLFQPFG